jgi:hypothetical protein
MRWRGISKDAGDDTERELVDSNRWQTARAVPPLLAAQRPSWFDKLTMRAFVEGLILSLSKDVADSTNRETALAVC